MSFSTNHCNSDRKIFIYKKEEILRQHLTQVTQVKSNKFEEKPIEVRVSFKEIHRGDPREGPEGPWSLGWPPSLNELV